MKDRPKTRPSLQVQHDLSRKNLHSYEMARAGGNDLNYMRQKDRCAARGGVLA
jgi:hypothetical protein